MNYICTLPKVTPLAMTYACSTHEQAYVIAKFCVASSVISLILHKVMMYVLSHNYILYIHTYV